MVLRGVRGGSVRGGGVGCEGRRCGVRGGGVLMCVLQMSSVWV